MRLLTTLHSRLLTGVLVFTALGHRALAADAPATQPAGAALFIEDFESGALKKDVWSERVNGGATLTVQHEVVAHGKSALLVRYPAASKGYAFAVAVHQPEALKEHFFGRAYVQFPKAPPNAHDVFITAGSAGFPNSNFLELGLRQNKVQVSSQQNGPGVPRAETMIAGPVYPVGKWFCLEWEMNDNPDAIVMWIDGEKTVDAKVPLRGGAKDHIVNGFVDFGFGFRSWGNVPAGFDVYYDDIAFGTSRIGPIK